MREGTSHTLPVNLLWRFGIEVLPVTPSLYAALHKVNCLVASRLAEPDAEFSSCKAKWDELAALLEYVTYFMVCIQNSMVFSLRTLLIRISELIVMKRLDILSLCVRETTRYMDPKDAISTVWRLECEIARFEVPFYEGSTFVYLKLIIPDIVPRNEDVRNEERQSILIVIQSTLSYEFNTP